MIKVWSLIVFSSLFLSFGIKDKEHSDYQVIINQDSHISIRGKSNVNRFNCQYFGLLSAGDTLYVKVVEAGYHKIIEESALNIEVDLFDCGIRQITTDMRDLLSADDFPFLTVRVRQFELSKDIVKVKTLIAIAGKEAECVFSAQVNDLGKWKNYQGSMDLNIRTFGLEPPRKLLGAIRVHEIITIDFDLTLQIEEIS